MREIVFDKEKKGMERMEERVIEIGGVEIVKRFNKGRKLNKLINKKGSKVNKDEIEVNGIRKEKLMEKKVFEEIMEEFMELIEGERIVENKEMLEIGLINEEIERIEKEEIN